MAKKPEKVAVIGLDCALPHLIEQHISEGHLPNFKKLIDGGMIADNCLVPFPTVTPPNWATIATGAWAGTHSITDFHVHETGTRLDNSNVFAAFSSQRVTAEYIWDALDKAGYKCIVANYPGSWPSKMKNGIVLGGSGLTTGEKRDGTMGLDSEYMAGGSQLISTAMYPLATRIKFAPAQGWEGVDEMGDDPLEASFVVAPGKPFAPLGENTWHVLVREMGEDGYDTVTLAPTKNMAEAFFSIKLNEWAPKAFTTIKMADGSDQEIFFRAKLLELSDDAEDFRLYISELCQTAGWSDPPEIAKEITSEEGTFSHGGGLKGWPIGWFGLDTYAEISAMHDIWLGDMVTQTLSNHEWDLFYMHSHPPDWVYHAIITDMDPETQPDEEIRKAAWECHLKIYQSQDKMLGRIMETVGKKALVVLVSDHGAVADGPMFNPYEALVPAGLCAEPEPMAEMSDLTGYAAKALKHIAKVPDPAKSQAIPQREIYVYINLKGRDPGGIVDPADYEKVQRQIIDCLITYVDPSTGERPVALALTKQDARILGLYGDGIGDVVYALYPEFGSQHGQILPTATRGVGSLKGLLTMTGPGVPKGLRLERTIWLTDLVPTICYLMDWPVPENAEGAIIYQAFKDPNFKTKELSKLQEGLKRMEVALQRSEREPWDKHDCA